MDVNALTIWILAMTNVGTLVLGFILGFPAGRKSVFKEAKANKQYGDMR